LSRTHARIIQHLKSRQGGVASLTLVMPQLLWLSAGCLPHEQRLAMHVGSLLAVLRQSDVVAICRAAATMLAGPCCGRLPCRHGGAGAASGRVLQSSYEAMSTKLKNCAKRRSVAPQGRAKSAIGVD